MAETRPMASIRARVGTLPRGVWVVLGVAFALRLAWVLYAAREPFNFGDPFIYVSAARRIAEGKGYGPWFSTGPTAFHPIGYPGWLAGIDFVARHVGLDSHFPLLIGLTQAVLGTASVALVYSITRRLFDHRIAIWAAALTACFPNLVFYTALAYSETLYTFGVLLAVWLLVRAPSTRALSPRVLVPFGIVIGLSTLVRPFAFVTVIPLGIAAMRAGAGFRVAARNVGIVGGIAILLLVPWTIRNAFAFHAFVPISTNLGDTLCLDNSPGAYGGFRDLPPECSPPAPSGYAEPGRNSHNLRYALRWAVHHPLEEAKLVVRRAYYGYRDDHDSLSDLAGAPKRFPPSWLRIPLSHVADWYYYVVVALAIPAVAKFWRDPRRLFVLLVGASLAIVPLYLYGLARFHVPLAPFFAIGAAVTIDTLRRWRALRRSGGTA